MYFPLTNAYTSFLVSGDGKPYHGLDYDQRKIFNEFAKTAREREDRKIADEVNGGKRLVIVTPEYFQYAHCLRRINDYLDKRLDRYQAVWIGSLRSDMFKMSGRQPQDVIVVVLWVAHTDQKMVYHINELTKLGYELHYDLYL